MNRRFRWAVCSTLMFVSAPVLVHADDTETIDYRKHVMKTLGENAQAVSMIVQKKAPAENFNAHVKALALASSQALKAFEPEAEGGNAKPEVWKNWKDFSAKMNELSANLAALDKTAQTQGMAAAAAKIKTSFTCQGCHDTYWAEKPPAPKPSTDKDEVTYRRHVMSALDSQSAALGQILSGSVPDDNQTSHFEALAAIASTSLKSFEPKVPGGEAKPEVWSNWPDFSARMTQFAQKTAATAKIAKEQGNEAATSSIMEALTCKGCHDKYRTQK